MSASMTCPACGFTNLPDARFFCSSCGGSMAELPRAVVAVRPAPARAMVDVGHRAYVAAAFAARRHARCPHCGVPAQPMPYFSRGVNIGKAMALMLPFSFIGPLLFFLFRKDRIICSVCMRVLPGEQALPLLDAFSADGARALADSGGAGAAMIAVVEGERDLAVLEARQQRLRGRALALGIFSAGFAGLALMSGVQGTFGASVGLLVMALPTTLATAWSAIKSRALRREIAGRRQHNRTMGVLALARAHGGRLNVTLVAAELSLDLKEAERLLDSLVDGHRVDLHVDDGGRVTYVFPELMT